MNKSNRRDPIRKSPFPSRVNFSSPPSLPAELLDPARQSFHAMWETLSSVCAKLTKSIFRDSSSQSSPRKSRLASPSFLRTFFYISRQCIAISLLPENTHESLCSQQCWTRLSQSRTFRFRLHSSLSLTARSLHRSTLEIIGVPQSPPRPSYKSRKQRGRNGTSSESSPRVSQSSPTKHERDGSTRDGNDGFIPPITLRARIKRR